MRRDNGAETSARRDEAEQGRASQGQVKVGVQRRGDMRMCVEGWERQQADARCDEILGITRRVGEEDGQAVR